MLSPYEWLAVPCAIAAEMLFAFTNRRAAFAATQRFTGYWFRPMVIFRQRVTL
jgi:hypothetical protein